VRWRPTHLSQNQRGAADRSRADRLRVPADTEKRGRQTDQRRQRTPTTRRESQLAMQDSSGARVASAFARGARLRERVPTPERVCRREPVQTSSSIVPPRANQWTRSVKGEVANFCIAVSRGSRKCFHASKCSGTIAFGLSSRHSSIASSAFSV
jgi:hypothetical protein